MPDRFRREQRNAQLRQADRITDAGYAYDALGRTTAVPDGDTLDLGGASGGATVSYHVNDLVRSVVQGAGAMTTYNLDVNGQRVRSKVSGSTTVLGTAQRAGDNPAGLTLMGVRVYNPASGRFLQTDPIPGGNANACVYPEAPINNFDLDGRSRAGDESGSEVAYYAGRAAYYGARVLVQLAGLKYLISGKQGL